METRTEQRLLVAFTAALALATFGLVAESHWSSEKQLRAYVYLNPSEAFHIDGQGMLQVYSIVGNSGLTPASNVQRFAGIEVLPPTDIPAQRTVREVGSTVIGPRSEIALIKNWAHGQVSADQAQQIRKGDLRVYVFGKIFYDDVFGYHWESDFCNAYYGNEGFEHLEPTDADPNTQPLAIRAGKPNLAKRATK